MASVLLSTAALVTLSATATAQKLDTILARLGSDDPVRMAWGAYDSQLKDAKTLRPALESALRRTFRQKKGGHARAAILDALVRLKAKPDAAALRRCLSGVHAGAALSVMARHPKHYEDALLEVVWENERSLRRPEWVAAGNLLVSIGSKRLAPLLLRKLYVDITIGIHEPKSRIDAARVFRTESASTGGRRWSLPKGYPRYTIHELVDLGQLQRYERERLFVDKTRIAPGPQDIWCVRHGKEWPAKLAARAARTSADYHAIRIGWIAGLLGTKPESLALQLRPFEGHEWKDDATFTRAVERAIEKAKGHHAAAINRLIREKRLDPKLRERFELRATVFVFDARRRRTPLPKVPGVRVKSIDPN